MNTACRSAPLTGAEITPRHWDAFFAFYMDTGNRKMGPARISRGASSISSAPAWRRNVVLMFAEKDGRPVRGCL